MSQSTTNADVELKELLPWGRKLVIRPTIVPKYRGDLIIPESVRSTVPTTGTVLALGFELQQEQDYPLHVGDKIIFSKYGGVEIKFTDGKVLIVLHEDDILAIMGADMAMEEKDS